MTGLRCHFVTKAIRVIVVTSLGGMLPSPSLAQTIVWTDANARKIQRKDVNGGAAATIVQFPAPETAYGVQYEPIAAKFYYFSSGTTSHFRRINVDGSDPEDISTPSSGPFALDIELRKLYWSTCTAMHRSELNGTGVESHSYQSGCLFPRLALGNELYLGSSAALPKGIWRADADGSNEQLLHASGAPTGVAYDPVENKLYVAAFDNIYRLNPDGSGFQQVVFLPVWQQGISGPEYVVVDYRGRKLYWTDNLRKVIQRSNLDGSNVEDFVTPGDAGNPQLEIQGLTIVYTAEPIPTLTGWGLIAMSATLFAAGLFVLRRRLGKQSDA